MKHVSKLAIATAMIMVTSHAVAYELGEGFDASANVGVVSNYMWRGMTQTRNGAALQGGLDLAHSSGFYAGTWLSNVDFKFFPGADTEQDFYAGYGWSLGDFAFDLKRTEYHYASENGLNFGETHAHVSAYSVTLGADYSSDTPVLASDSAIHYYGSYSYSLPADISLSATVGEYDYRDGGWIGGTDSRYTYYAVSLNKTLWGVNFGASYTNTNVDQNNCLVFAGGDDYCGDVLLVSAVKTFK